MSTRKVVKSTPFYFIHRLLPLSIITVSLAACGGGGSSNHNNSKHSSSAAKKTAASDKTGQSTNNTVPNNTNTDLSPMSNGLSAVDLAVYNEFNMRRTACGFGSLESHKQLQNAATNHANYLLYMSKHSTSGFQGHHETKVDGYSGSNNPYFTGYAVEDRIKSNGYIGSKAIPVNYVYQTAGENLSFIAFNTPYFKQNNDNTIALSSLSGLLAAPYHMASMLSPRFTQVGVRYGREKIKNEKGYFGSVLEFVLASPQGGKVNQPSKILNYPCDGTVDTQYELTHEHPNPFGDNGRNLKDNPIGQPIYILGAGNITVSNYQMTDAAGKQVALKALTHRSDPNQLLTQSQVILLPLTSLKPNQAYRVSYQVSVDDGAKQTKNFVFYTKAK